MCYHQILPTSLDTMRENIKLPIAKKKKKIKCLIQGKLKVFRGRANPRLFLVINRLAFDGKFKW